MFKRLFLITTLLIGLGAITVPAQLSQDLTITSSPHPVGSGARAIGRGSAFIAIADDATAASWNPAGLVQLVRPEVSIVGSYFFRNEDMTFDDPGFSPKAQDYSRIDLNYLSASLPLEIGPVFLVASINYQRLYEFDRKVDFTLGGNSYGNNNFNFDVTSGKIEVEQVGEMTTISPAIALEITPRISVGLTVNLWNDSLSPNGWESRYRRSEIGVSRSRGIDGIFGNADDLISSYNGIQETREEFKFSGTNVNFNLGGLWDINDTWRIGAVLKTPMKASLDHKQYTASGQIFNSIPNFNDFGEFSSEKSAKLTLPLAYGAGVAYRRGDTFSAAFDIYRTEWYMYKLEEDGHEFNLITGDVDSADKVEPTYQIRVGAEYLLIKGKTVYPFRAGFGYDPDPGPGKPLDYYTASLGGGIKWKNLLIDGAYQFRFGPSVKGATIAEVESENDVNQHMFYLSSIYHF